MGQKSVWHTSAGHALVPQVSLQKSSPARSVLIQSEAVDDMVVEDTDVEVSEVVDIVVVDVAVPVLVDAEVVVRVPVDWVVEEVTEVVVFTWQKPHV